MPAKDRHRSTLACARCYQLKKKCDKRAPSCSRCLQAGQQCTSINRQKGVEVPRSIARYLEQLHAELINPSSQGHPLSVPFQTQRSKRNAQLPPSQNTEQLSSYVVQRGILALRCRYTTSLLRGHPTLHHRNRLFYGSERPPLKIYVGIHQEDPYQIPHFLFTSAAPNSGPLKVPAHVARLLLNVYIEDILPRYPCFRETDLRNHFDAVYQDRDSEECKPSESSRFIVAMVLAISSMTSKAHDFRKVALLSQSLHRDALRHSHFLRKSGITTLQGFFLLIQLALLLPHTGNLWYMTGEAMRMAIGLGLHVAHSQSDDIQLDDLRRRLFWTAYTLERSTSIPSGCPLAICEEVISTELPSKYKDDDIRIDVINSTRQHEPKRVHFLYHIRLRQLQTKVHIVQYFGSPLTDSAPSYGDWVILMEREIQNLHGMVTSSNGTGVDWFTNAIRHTRLMLYRPCPRNPTPSSFSIKSAITAAVGIVHGCWDLIHSGYLIFPFHNVYNAFQSGLVILYALKHHFQIVSANSLHSEIMEALELTPRLFSALAVRWPQAIDTCHYFGELKDVVLRHIQSPSIIEDAVQSIDLLAELDHLVTKRGVGALSCLNMSQIHSQAIEPPNIPDPMQLDFTMDESWKDFIDLGFGFDTADSVLMEDEAGIADLLPISSTSQDLSQDDSEHFNIAESILNLRSIIESLPACNLCRNRRTKCSRGLPSCSTCTNERKECLYYDAVLEQNLSRSYIHTLYTKITTSQPVSVPATPTLAAISTTQHIFLPWQEIFEISTLYQPDNDKTRSLDCVYFGSSSAFSVLRSTISTTSAWTAHSDNDIEALGSTITCVDDNTTVQGTEAVLPPRPNAEALVKIFARSVNIFYPTMHSHALDEMLLAAYDFPERFAGTFEERIFHLVIAIALQLTRRDDTSVGFTPNVYFRKAVYGYYSNTSQVLLLQENLLICIYLLLSPRSGDIWRNLGFSVRVYFDLGHHPSDDVDPDEQLTPLLFRTLYCLESQVAVAYGRPSLLSISDTVREDMTASISSDISESISIHFYRVSFIKLQILNEILSTTSDISRSINIELSNAWHEEWERDLESFIFPEFLDQKVFLRQLKAWGELMHCEIVLLLLQLDSSLTADKAIDNCTRFSHAGIDIKRYNIHSTSMCLTLKEISTNGSFIFPLTWTTTHAIFSSLLGLFSEARKHGLTGADGALRASTIRRCGGLLASLEADANTLSSGFSQVLEILCTLETQ